MGLMRPVRARLYVIRVNRWAAATALMLALFAALVLIPPVGLAPLVRGGATRIQPGVTLMGRDFSGLGRQEAEAILRELAAGFDTPPVDAQRQTDDSGISYVIPEIDGAGLDIEETWLRLSLSPPGAEVEPATTVLPASRRLADYPEDAIRQGNPAKNQVGLLINVDWGEAELFTMLPVLKRKGVRVTFFVSGRWAEKHPNLLRQMARDGHEIGTHGHNLTHGPRALAAAGRLRSDIEQSVLTIEEIIGREVRYYAPHMSEISPEILKTAADLNLRTVLYSLDTVDWRNSTTPAMILGTFQKAKAGDLILLHPKPNTAQVLEQAIDLLQQRGYQLVTLSEMLDSSPPPPAE